MSPWYRVALVAGGPVFALVKGHDRVSGTHTPWQNTFVEVRETTLPGVGLCYDFVTRSGKRVGVVTRPSGRRELVVYSSDDPDAVAESVDLSVDEAQALAEYLENQEIRDAGKGLAGLVEGLAVDWVTLPEDFPTRTIEELAIRSLTGASVVAVVHDAEADPSPGPDRVMQAGDTVVVVGTPEALTGVVALLCS